MSCHVVEIHKNRTSLLVSRHRTISHCGLWPLVALRHVLPVGSGYLANGKKLILRPRWLWSTAMPASDIFDDVGREERHERSDGARRHEHAERVVMHVMTLPRWRGIRKHAAMTLIVTWAHVIAAAWHRHYSPFWNMMRPWAGMRAGMCLMLFQDLGDHRKTGWKEKQDSESAPRSHATILREGVDRFHETEKNV